MKKNLMYITLFALGGTIGVVSARQYYKKIYAEMANSDIQQYKEYALGQVEAIRSEFAMATTVDHPSALTVAEHEAKYPVEKTSPAAQRIIRDYSAIATKKDIVTVMHERGVVPFDDHPHDDEAEESDDEDGEADEELDETPITFDKHDQSIRVITFEEFSNEEPNFEKLTLTYYEEDDVLTDERDGVIPEPTNIVGVRAFESFGKGAEPDVVYVRNNRNSSDFEIIRNHGSFSEIVLGAKVAPEARHTQVHKVREKKEEKPKAKTTKPRVKKVLSDGEN